MDIDVQRQVTESSLNKTLTEFKPGLYAQPSLHYGTQLNCMNKTQIAVVKFA